jgi:K+-transporting ATPase ATPase C chain
MSIVRPALVLLFLFTVLTGALYPAVVTAAAQVLFPDRANGSLVRQEGKIRGSRLIGQPFSDPGHFWSRPSATGPVPYNGAASSGSNQGPLNPALADTVKARIEALRAADPPDTRPVPVDLVTASGSGLDPHISPRGRPLSGRARRTRTRSITGSCEGARRTAHREPHPGDTRRATRQCARAQPCPGPS